MLKRFASHLNGGVFTYHLDLNLVKQNVHTRTKDVAALVMIAKTALLMAVRTIHKLDQI